MNDFERVTLKDVANRKQKEEVKSNSRGAKKKILLIREGLRCTLRAGH